MLEYFRRRRENEEGFTLIELMVVVLIIAILIAIAIPTFLGAQNRARDRAAQSDLRNAFTAAKSIATDFEGTFKTASGTCTDTGATFAAALETENASLTYAAGTTSSETAIAVSLSDSCKTLLLQRKSTSGKNYCLLAKQDGTTFRDVDTAGGDLSTTTCDVENGW
jgi:type IV pilus assembly protein PilA